MENYRAAFWQQPYFLVIVTVAATIVMGMIFLLVSYLTILGRDICVLVRCICSAMQKTCVYIYIYIYIYIKSHIKGMRHVCY